MNNNENIATASAPAIETKPKEEIQADFSGQTISLKEAMILACKSKVTLLKIIHEKKVACVGKIITGGRGRPASLYDRVQMMAAINQRGQ